MTGQQYMKLFKVVIIVLYIAFGKNIKNVYKSSDIQTKIASSKFTIHCIM